MNRPPRVTPLWAVLVISLGALAIGGFAVAMRADHVYWYGEHDHQIDHSHVAGRLGLLVGECVLTGTFALVALGLIVASSVPQPRAEYAWQSGDGAESTFACHPQLVTLAAMLRLVAAVGIFVAFEPWRYEIGSGGWSGWFQFGVALQTIAWIYAAWLGAPEKSVAPAERAAATSLA